MIILTWIAGVLVVVAVWLAAYGAGRKCYAIAAKRGWASAWCVASAMVAGFAALIAGMAITGLLVNQ